MRRRCILQTTVALAVGIAGCGQGNGDSTDAPTDESDDTPTPTPTESSVTPSSTDGSTDRPSSTAAQVVDVGPEEDKYSFEPNSFGIATGDKVLWVWQSDGHDVAIETAPDGADWEGETGDTYDSGHEHSHTFTTAGEYEYYCSPHQGLGMRGSFTVTE